MYTRTHIKRIRPRHEQDSNTRHTVQATEDRAIILIGTPFRDLDDCRLKHVHFH